MSMNHSLFLSCLLIAAPAMASAQAPPTPTTPPAPTASSPPANNCAPMKPGPQQGIVVPEGMTTGQAAEPLGDDVGSTPVIPPPGSPGGDPNVRPK